MRADSAAYPTVEYDREARKITVRGGLTKGEEIYLRCFEALLSTLSPANAIDLDEMTATKLASSATLARDKAYQELKEEDAAKRSDQMGKLERENTELSRRVDALEQQHVIGVPTLG